MGKKSASQRARKAERRARQQEADAQPSNGASTKSASADAAASSKSSAEAVDHSTSARGARMTKRRKSAVWRRRLRVSAIAIAIGVPALLLFAFIGGVFEPQLGVEAPNEGGVGAHVGQGRELSQDNRPPSSGLHYPSAASYSISAQPVPAGNWLHNLEHGGIVILYRCADQQECGEAASLVRGEVSSRASDGAFGQVKIVGTPYQDMDTPWTAVAWRRTLPLEEFDAEQLLAFYERYVDRGPERAP
ncbi:MAG: DUF3105 domain-containing protein [Chloroflexota bacterium]